jgi:hypothetical protein
MPESDPLPGLRASAIARFRGMMARMTLVSLVTAAIAVAIVAAGDPGLHIHMLIATGLGVFLTVLLAAALMNLIFLSSSSGHDSEAAQSRKKDSE